MVAATAPILAGGASRGAFVAGDAPASPDLATSRPSSDAYVDRPRSRAPPYGAGDPFTLGTSRLNPGVRTSRMGRSGDVCSTKNVTPSRSSIASTAES